MFVRWPPKPDGITVELFPYGIGSGKCTFGAVEAVVRDLIGLTVVAGPLRWAKALSTLCLTCAKRE